MLCGALADCFSTCGLEEEINSFRDTEIKVKTQKKVMKSIAGTKISFSVTGKKPPPDLNGIKDFIKSSSFNEKIKKKMVDFYLQIFLAEGAVHGRDPADVKLHELAAPHKIAEIAAFFILIGEHEVFFDYPLLGRGRARTAHGKVPLPSPATAEIFKDIPVQFSNNDREMFTPSAAALLKVSGCPSRPGMIPERTGYGIGERSILRLFLGRKTDLCLPGKILEIEFNLDDMIPEDIPFFIEKISDAAVDFWITPVIMKKSRPGHKISLLAEKKEFNQIRELIFNHTSTSGIRVKEVDREIIERHISRISTSIGKCSIKKYMLPSGKIRIKPEYRDIKMLAEKNKISADRARRIVIRESDI